MARIDKFDIPGPDNQPDWRHEHHAHHYMGPTVLILAFILAYLFFADGFGLWPFHIFDEAGRKDDQICAQVITPAQNSETGEIREFPTPCDVPDGWEALAPGQSRPDDEFSDFEQVIRESGDLPNIFLSNRFGYRINYPTAWVVGTSAAESDFFENAEFCDSSFGNAVNATYSSGGCFYLHPPATNLSGIRFQIIRPDPAITTEETIEWKHNIQTESAPRFDHPDLSGYLVRNRYIDRYIDRYVVLDNGQYIFEFFIAGDQGISSIESEIIKSFTLF